MFNNQFEYKYLQPESTVDPSYNAWLAENFPRKADLLKMAETWDTFAYQPLISIITPVYNTPASYLRQTIESVIHQVYPHWELCIADDASTEPHVKAILQEYAEQDSRIKITFREENGHISRSSNSALELAQGEYVALLDHDDLLTPDALYEVVLLLNRYPEADMIYSDEDKVDDSGKLKEPYFKPDWSPDSFLARMYICHLGVYRRSIVNQIGGFRAGYEGSQDYDLVLRFTEKTERIFHIPKVLYHWRVHPQSVAGGGEAKPYAFIAAEKALNDAIARRGEQGSIKCIGYFLGAYITRYKILEPKLVSIIIRATTIQSLNRCLNAIFSRSTYSNYEVIVVDSYFSQAALSTLAAKYSLQSSDQLKHFSCNSDANLASNFNQAVAQAQGEFLLFLHDNVESISPDWIDALIEQAQRASIGCASGLLVYPDDRVWHAGMILGMGDGIVGYIHRHLPVKALGYFGQVISINNYSAVTGACLMCKREVFEQVHGFTEVLAATYYDVDFCLKAGEKGLRHVYLPHVVLQYHESNSSYQAIRKQVQSTQEEIYMHKRWGHLIRRDPHYNSNFSLEASYAIKIDRKKVDECHDFNQLAFQLYETQKSLKETQERLQAMKSRLQSKLARAQLETEQIKAALKETQQRLEVMEISKFWKLRNSWFQFKKQLGLSLDE